MDPGTNGKKKSRKSNFLELAAGRYRAPDPLLHVRRKFILRRIAGDAEKIELGDNAGAAIHLRLLQATGFGLASIDAAAPRSSRAIGKDPDKRPRGWLNDAAETATAEVRRDFRQWKKRSK